MHLYQTQTILELCSAIKKMLTDNTPLLRSVQGKISLTSKDTSPSGIKSKYQTYAEQIRRNANNFSFNVDPRQLQGLVEQYAKQLEKTYGFRDPNPRSFVEENLVGEFELLKLCTVELQMEEELLASEMAILENDRQLGKWEDVVMKCYLSRMNGKPDGACRVYRREELFGRPGQRKIVIRIPQNFSAASVASKALNKTNVSKNTVGEAPKTGQVGAMQEYDRIKNLAELKAWSNGSFGQLLDQTASKPDLYAQKQSINNFFSVAMTIQYIYQQMCKSEQGQTKTDYGRTFMNSLLNNKFLKRSVLQGILFNIISKKGIKLNLIKFPKPYSIRYQTKPPLFYTEMDDDYIDASDDQSQIMNKDHLSKALGNFKELLLNEMQMPRFAAALYLACSSLLKENSKHMYKWIVEA